MAIGSPVAGDGDGGPACLREAEAADGTEGGARWGGGGCETGPGDLLVLRLLRRPPPRTFFALDSRFGGPPPDFFLSPSVPAPGFQLELKLRIVLTECRGVSLPDNDEFANAEDDTAAPPAEEQFLVGGRDVEAVVSADLLCAAAPRDDMSTEMRDADLRSFLTSLRAPVSAHSRSAAPPAMSATARLVPRWGDSSGPGGVEAVACCWWGGCWRPLLLRDRVPVDGRGYRVCGGSPEAGALVAE